METPLIFGIIATVIAIVILVIDQKQPLNDSVKQWIHRNIFRDNPDSIATVERFYSVSKGLIFIFFLFSIVGVFIYYYQ